MHCPGGTSLSLLLPSGTVLGVGELRNKLTSAVETSNVATKWVASVADKEGTRAVLLHHLARRVAQTLGIDQGSAVATELSNTQAEPPLVGGLGLGLDGTATKQALVRWVLDTPRYFDGLTRQAIEASDAGAILANLALLGHAETLDPASSAPSPGAESLRCDVSFSVVFEVRLSSLPRAGQRSALLRFAPPPVMPGRHAKRQEASVYVNDKGLLVGNSSMVMVMATATAKLSPPTEEEAKPEPSNGSPGAEPEPEPEVEAEAEAEVEAKPDLQPEEVVGGGISAGRWHVLVATVDRQAHKLSMFIDGSWVGDATLSLADADAKAEELHVGGGALNLGNRIVLLGGGKQSESRGGDVRKVRVVDGHLSPSQVQRLSVALQADNPLLNGAAVAIQACARRRLARVRCAKERGVKISELPGTKSLRRQAELLANLDQDDY
jgi:hypothetical protein